MSLVFCGIAAHTPILMPKIGKEEGLKMIEQTVQATAKLKQELIDSNPDILIIISPHGEMMTDAITINLSSKYVSDFVEFSDLVTKNEWYPATMLINRIRETFKQEHLPLTLISEEKLDYGVSVVLHQLIEPIKNNIRLIPLRPSSGLGLKTHFKLGASLKNEIADSTQRVAVIASADLSHRVGENSPSGFSPKGIAFDEKIIELVKEKNLIGILDIDENVVEEAQACGAGPLALLFGLLDRINIDPQIISYEKPLGVGYLVATIKIP